jgi:hypothetical protein
MTELLSIVAKLDHGAVILPGLDRTRDNAEWLAIQEDASHPQHLMAGLLKAFDLTPSDVRDWPPAPVPPSYGFEGLSDLPLFARVAPSLRERVPTAARRMKIHALDGFGSSRKLCDRRDHRRVARLRRTDNTSMGSAASIVRAHSRRR